MGLKKQEIIEENKNLKAENKNLKEILSRLFPAFIFKYYIAKEDMDEINSILQKFEREGE